jgi:hypothetical protein
MSEYQNAGRSHSTKIDNSYCEIAVGFLYVGTNLNNSNRIQEEIKNRL